MSFEAQLKTLDFLYRFLEAYIMALPFLCLIMAVIYQRELSKDD